MLLEEIFQLNEGINDPNIFKAIFVCGLPGAGKNYIIQQLNLVECGLKLVDIDQTAGQLEKLKQIRNKNYQDFTEIFKQRQSLWVKNFLGLVISATGRRADKMVEVNRDLSKAGYETMMLFVDIDKETALKRINYRYQTATNLSDKNRIVDIAYFNDAYEQLQYNISLYENMFGDNFIRILNDANGKESIHMARRKIRAFLQKPISKQARDIISQVRNQNVSV
jgi:shikimate kinase